MHNLWFRWLAVLLAFVFFAAACGGETTDDSGDDADDAAEQGDDSGDDSGDDTGDDAPEETTGDDAPEETDDDMEDEEMEEEAGPNIYEDPRGGIFLEFQQGFDRGDHPFMQYDSFCLPHEPAANRVDTDDGITADSIKVGHIRSLLEDLASIGFAVPVGDPKEIFEVFIDYINVECGGIRGRMLDLGYTEAEVLANVDSSRNAACLAMTEDHKSVIVMNSTGFQGTANLCLVEEQETIFISTQGQTEEFMDRSNDLLLSLSPTLEESLGFLVSDLLGRGELEGRRTPPVDATGRP